MTKYYCMITVVQLPSIHCAYNRLLTLSHMDGGNMIMANRGWHGVHGGRNRDHSAAKTTIQIFPRDKEWRWQWVSRGFFKQAKHSHGYVGVINEVDRNRLWWDLHVNVAHPQKVRGQGTLGPQVVYVAPLTCPVFFSQFNKIISHTK